VHAKASKRQRPAPPSSGAISELGCGAYTNKPGSGSNQAPTLYHVGFIWRGQRWEVFRRYNDFKSLHEQLKSLYEPVGPFKFPRKSKLFTHSTSTKDQRLKAFDEYLRLLGRLDPPPLELYEFLQVVHACAFVINARTESWYRRSWLAMGA